MRKSFVALGLVLGLMGQSLAYGAVDATATQRLIAEQGLFFSLARNDVANMAALRDQGADPNATLTRVGLKAKDVFDPRLSIFAKPFDAFSPAGWPILTWAVYLNNPEATRLLLRAGARVGGTDEYGATALHWAAWAGQHELAKQLLNNGANCKARDFKGRTPKDWAIMVSNVDMIRLLDSRSCRGGDGDEDQDGVVDSLDMCPGTPLGAQVDERGCWIVAYATFFDFNRAVIKPEFLPHVRQAARVLANNPGIQVALVGHTDSVGSDEF
ncbi:MAG: ankyrin repeat domain-containing protein, partial [Deltaproteobacteria bacterium]|nr:ankyrin repeat domain-containing protein [Deltaproteobacteria bacterium]